MKGMGRVRGPCCICSGDMMNFIDPANRKRRAARIWAAQRRRLAVRAVEVDMIGVSGGVSAGWGPGDSGLLPPLTITSNGRTRNRHDPQTLRLDGFRWVAAWRQRFADVA